MTPLVILVAKITWSLEGQIHHDSSTGLIVSALDICLYNDVSIMNNVALIGKKAKFIRMYCILMI